MIPKDIKSAVYLLQYMHVFDKHIISIQIYCHAKMFKT